METIIEIRKANPTTNNLKYFNDNVSIARSEIIRMFAKPEQRNGEMVVNAEMTISNGDSVTIVPFELRTKKIVGDIYNYSKTQIHTTNKDFSQRIKAEMDKCITDLRKPY